MFTTFQTLSSQTELQTCLPPSVGSTMAAVIIFATVSAAAFAMITAEILEFKGLRCAVATAFTAVVVFAFISFAGALIHHGSSVDYERCEQRKLTVQP